MEWIRCSAAGAAVRRTVRFFRRCRGLFPARCSARLKAASDTWRSWRKCARMSSRKERLQTAFIRLQREFVRTRRQVVRGGTEAAIGAAAVEWAGFVKTLWIEPRASITNSRTVRRIPPGSWTEYG